MRRLVQWLMGIAMLLTSAAAAQMPQGLDPAGEATVTAVIDGDTVVLADGRQVRLIGIQAPKLGLGRPGFVDWPLAAAARQALAGLAEGRRVTLATGGLRTDRYGRTLAQLFRDDGLWLQAEMVRRGMARVYSFADNRTAVRDLLAIEEAARQAGHGLWADRFYRIRRPGDLADAADTYQLVEGRVLDAAAVGSRVYLNFGADYHTDFTASLSAAAVRLFEGQGLDPLALQGRLVRIRGWVYPRNGPAIDITHPEQVEVLDGPG